MSYEDSAQEEAYYSLVQGGLNAMLGHYNAGQRQMKDREFLVLLLIKDLVATQCLSEGTLRVGIFKRALVPASNGIIPIKTQYYFLSEGLSRFSGSPALWDPA